MIHGVTDTDPTPILSGWKKDGIGAILIQYVPFLYGRSGLSRFPARIARAAKVAGLRVTLFVHETWVPPTRLPWRILSPLQRGQLLRLRRLPDAVVTAVPAWRALLGGDVAVIYVGSNLGDPPANAPSLHSPVVFSPFAAGLNWDWIAAAVRAIGASPGLVVVGADAETARRHPQTAGVFDPTWEWRGRLPTPQALRVLAGAYVGLAPFIDGATGRRTSLLALLSTGMRVVSSRGHLFDPFFEQGPVEAAGSREAYVAAACRAWEPAEPPDARAERVAWYGRHLHPRQLDARLLAVVTGGVA